MVAGQCNLCGDNKARFLLSKDGFDLYRCASCGLAFTCPQPSDVAEQYNCSYFDLYRKRRAFRLKRAARRLQAIELLAQPGRLLDIGCSLGYFVEAANLRGWNASGVEISSCASGEARAMGLDVKTGILQDAGYADGAFDCVTMWDVLEHVPDPLAHMREVHRVLVEGGLAVIGTPDIGHIKFKIDGAGWRHIKPDQHLFYFDRNTISRLLSLAGFDLVCPPVFGGRSFQGIRAAALKCWFARVFRPIDVMTVYGVKR